MLGLVAVDPMVCFGLLKALESVVFEAVTMHLRVRLANCWAVNIPLVNISAICLFVSMYLMKISN